ncbi:GAF and ANTAR domain-containing protein [Cellulomonas sp. NPDC057328]|uniref:GAF and ANTAR domain-containing protein n=1 Tax=Cellulomonas sp. NPDC057328 TaxID=3346101 RepID=UPI003634C73C
MCTTLQRASADPASRRRENAPHHAVAHGVRSSLSVPMRAGGVLVGALNSYGRSPGLFVDELRHTVIDFARQAEKVVALALRHGEQNALLDDMQAAMRSRSVIDQALGILMAQQRCTADEAFAVLRRASQGRNRKVADIAGDIVVAVSGGSPRPGHFGRGMPTDRARATS